MKHFLLLSLFSTFIASHTKAYDHPEFLYPVGPIFFENSEKICVIYQKDTYLELLFWDPITNKTIKGLSHYTPAGLMILPSLQAFSFIDHQRIRIKKIEKKSPQSFDLDPLYDFNILHWIDDQNCYCSARERMHYNLFHITTEGDFYRLTRSQEADYVYPQKIDEHFFYIKKDQEGNHSIEKTYYPAAALENCKTCLASMYAAPITSLASIEKIALEETESTSKACLITQPASTLFSCCDQRNALSFLTMLNKHEGFFLEHLHYPFIERFETMMKFSCCNLQEQADGSWSSKKLFEFTIPLDLLYGKNRLYESGLRLFPVYTTNAIYFVSANNEGMLDVYWYNTIDTTITCMTKMNSEHYFFPPCVYKGIAYSGGMLMEENDQEDSMRIKMTLDQDGNQEIYFPHFTV